MPGSTLQSIDGTAVLLPVDPDRSGPRDPGQDRRRGRRPVWAWWSPTLMDVRSGGAGERRPRVALGSKPVLDHRGETDRQGRILVGNRAALADELAAASGVLMGKSAGLPVIVVSGVETDPSPGGSPGWIRNPAHDLFR